ncbi:MAG: DNRLRE domain-containing protein [Sporocytophaga sp.]|uniref:DNRLRE domain-containing protein n=1 Tax=Sporocytophaga sp. TaxID=2231183 RepID=UPI001B07D8B4|nr:DNRLRE domain-containing protein [Sporocytophaga sp.]MBO9699477.1 DNRLRE domain-containing protein [Sporocytophaga sp.]
MLSPSKSRIVACRTLDIIEKALFIVSIILPLSCSHPICEEIINKNPGKQIILKSITLQPGKEGKDAIVSSYFPETNFENSKTLNAVLWRKDRNRYIEKGYIDFDLPNLIPSDAKIKKATLKLFADTVNQIDEGYLPKGHYEADYLPWEINIVTNTWTEKDITWINQPEASIEALEIFNGAERNDQAFLIDVTSYVDEKVKQDPNVHGLVIDIIYHTMWEGFIRFCTSDHQNSELRPQLYVEFEIEQ